MLDDIGLPCGRLELDQIASFAFGFDGLAFAILDGRRSDAGAGKAACSAALGVDRNRRGFSLTPIGGDNKVSTRHEALEGTGVPCLGQGGEDLDRPLMAL